MSLCQRSWSSRTGNQGRLPAWWIVLDLYPTLCCAESAHEEAMQLSPRAGSYSCMEYRAWHHMTPLSGVGTDYGKAM